MDTKKILGRGIARFSQVAAGLAMIGALAATAPLAAPLSAQVPDVDRERDRDCRCVDRDGNAIEDCVCLTTPSMDGLITLAPFERRSIIGVSIDYSQGSEADAEGARIMEVQDGGPADRAGMREGDIVVRVDGRSVFDPLDRSEERQLSEGTSVPVQRFARLVGALEPGEPVELVIRRDGSQRTLTVTPDEADALALPSFQFFGDDIPGLSLRMDGNRWREELGELRGRLNEEGWSEDAPGIYRFEGPNRSGEIRFRGGDGDGEPLAFRLRGDGDGESLAFRFRGDGDGEPFAFRFRGDPCMDLADAGEPRVWVLGGGNCVQGVEFIELNPDLGEYFGTDEGILVARVAESSQLGLRAGDVLMAIDGREVRSTDHARRILSSYEADEEIRLRIMRQGSETEVLARLD
jgi:hypothetical protein